MKRIMAFLLALILTFVFLSSLSISEATGGRGGHGHHGGHHGGFHGRFYFGFGLGFWPGYYGGYYPFYWRAPVVGWPYGGWPYVGWPYYPPQAPEAAQPYRVPEQQQPYYWYYCEDSQGYYPYVKSCPGGWVQVIPNVTPPNQ